MDILKRLLIAPVVAFLVVSLIYLYFLCKVRSFICCKGEGQFYRTRERLSDMDILTRLLIVPVVAFLVASLIYLYFLCQVRSLVCCKGEGQF